jgi:hypothetical protein
MAEYKGKKQADMRKSNKASASGFDAFGKPVPYYRRDAALSHCRAMGLSDTNKAMATIDRMSEAIRRDEPYQAMEAGMVWLDLTGTYRLLAVLCTAEKCDGKAAS